MPKYVPHTWDKYGQPNLDNDIEGIDAESLDELYVLEEEAEDLRVEISRLESDLDDLEAALEDAQNSLRHTNDQIERIRNRIGYP